jgi:uncharacterized membrane protein YuzA (DUF378 family)
MKFFHLITLLLVILGGINWTFMGLMHVDLFAAIFGTTVITTLLYVLVTVFTLYHVLPRLMEQLNTTTS